jgi:hypothetical protein
VKPRQLIRQHDKNKDTTPFLLLQVAVSNTASGRDTLCVFFQRLCPRNTSGADLDSARELTNGSVSFEAQRILHIKSPVVTLKPRSCVPREWSASKRGK